MAVPIVMSRRTYSRIGVPDDTFIAIDDFENLDDFVFRIKQIASDKESYLEYHRWRETYRFVENCL